MTISVGVGGVNRTVAAMWVGVSGVWRAVSRLDTGVSGVWRFGFSPVTFATGYSASATALSPSNANARIRFDADGHVYRVLNAIETDVGTWLTAGDSANFDAFATLTSGTLTSGTVGSAVNLGLSPTWHVQKSGFGTVNAVVDVSIRLAGTSTEVDSTTLTLSATVDI